MFCHERFSLAEGAASTCASWRSLDGQHAERRTATHEQHARLRLDAPVVVTTCAGQEIPVEILTKVVEAVKSGKAALVTKPSNGERPSMNATDIRVGTAARLIAFMPITSSYGRRLPTSASKSITA
jgi:hypothetical protein